MIALSKNTAACFQHVQPKSIHDSLKASVLYQSVADSQKRWFKNNDVFFSRFRQLVWLWLVATRRPLRGDFTSPTSGFDRSTQVGNWRLRPLGWWQFSIKKRPAASLCLWKLRLGGSDEFRECWKCIYHAALKNQSMACIHICTDIKVMGHGSMGPDLCKNKCFFLWMATKILTQTIERPLACTSRIKPLHGLQTPRSEGSSTHKATSTHSVMKLMVTNCEWILNAFNNGWMCYNLWVNMESWWIFPVGTGSVFFGIWSSWIDVFWLSAERSLNKMQPTQANTPLHPTWTRNGWGFEPGICRGVPFF